MIDRRDAMRKKKKLSVGEDVFKNLIQRECYYVDKTLLIRDLLDFGGKVTLFTRPRRFGKTLNMTMLQSFFEDAIDFRGNPVENRGLFEGLAISDCGEDYMEHQGKYPVIQMSLKGTKALNPGHAMNLLCLEITKEFRRHRYLLKEDVVSEEEREIYDRILFEKGTETDYENSLLLLSEWLHRFHEKNVIILIDEYDVPLENAFQNGFYPQMVGFIRSFFERGLKTNPYLEFAVVTGCLRISKESIFTGMNNLEVRSILSNDFDEYFGFTDQEIRQMCEYYEITDYYDELKDWYNGYVFGVENVYNPWSAVSYIGDKSRHPDIYPESYWANTSSNHIVRDLIDVADRGTRDEIEVLIKGGSIEKMVHEDVTYGEIHQSMENFWNILFFTGYLRKVSERSGEDGETQFLTMRIPNREVHYIFMQKIRNWFDEVKKRDVSILFRAIQENDTQVMQKELGAILIKTISYFDYAENFYHGFLAGVLYGMGDYQVVSNRESGNGRTDLILRPFDHTQSAFIFEFKIAKDVARMESRAKEALAQIRDKKYDTELVQAGYQSVVCYGVAFCGKNLVVV